MTSRSDIRYSVRNSLCAQIQPNSSNLTWGHFNIRFIHSFNSCSPLNKIKIDKLICYSLVSISQMWISEYYIVDFVTCSCQLNIILPVLVLVMQNKTSEEYLFWLCKSLILETIVSFSPNGRSFALDPQKKYEQLLEEQKDLAIARDDSRKMAEQCKQRSEKMAEIITRDQQSNKEQMEKEKVCCFSLLIFSSHGCFELFSYLTAEFGVVFTCWRFSVFTGSHPRSSTFNCCCDIADYAGSRCASHSNISANIENYKSCVCDLSSDVTKRTDRKINAIESEFLWISVF